MRIQFHGRVSRRSPCTMALSPKRTNAHRTPHNNAISEERAKKTEARAHARIHTTNWRYYNYMSLLSSNETIPSARTLHITRSSANPTAEMSMWRSVHHSYTETSMFAIMCSSSFHIRSHNARWLVPTLNLCACAAMPSPFSYYLLRSSFL